MKLVVRLVDSLDNNGSRETVGPRRGY